MKKTTEQVQSELNKNFKFLLILDEYTGANNKNLIKCTECSHEWKAVVRSVKNSKGGCPKCGVAKLHKERAKQNFISKLSNDFEFISFTNPKEASVKCKKCGNSRVTTTDNILRFGCKSCASSKANESRKLSTEEFIERAIKIHGDTYDYSKSKYESYNEKITITCKLHEDFSQRAGKHLIGQGCPKCCVSAGEAIVRELLIKNNVVFTQEKFMAIPQQIRVDFYFELGEEKCVVEVNGQQHYQSTEFFGGDTEFKRQKKRDLNLKNYCVEKGIRILFVPFGFKKYNIEYLTKQVQKFIKLPSRQEIV